MDKKTDCLWIVGIFLLVCIAMYWLLLGVKGNGGHYDNIQTGLGNIETEQRRAEESIDRISEGIDRSQESAGRIGASVERSEDIARSIADDIRRNDDALRDALERIGDAESRKCEIDAGVKRCENRIADGIRCNHESKSIFERYEKGN